MIVLQNGRVIDPASGIDAARTVRIVNGRIDALVEPGVPAPEGAQVIDCTGKWIVPGLIDLHVHLREPGEEYKETIHSGVCSAVRGGFTGVVSMPNTKPVIDNAHLVRFVLDKAREAGLAKVYPAGAATKGQKGEELAEYGDMQSAGAVMMTDDGLPIMNPGVMRRALEYARAFDLPIMVHEEDKHLAAGGCMHEGRVSMRLGLKGFPAAAEDVMVLRDIEIAALTGGRLHIGHLSTAGAVRAVREAKRRGLRVTAEATPHHFTLTDEAVATYDTNAKMCPPLRSQEHVDAVLEGLADGTIDAIATDHAPHSAVEKDVEFERAANGIVGLETALPLTLALVRRGLLSEMRAIELLSTGPARTFSLPGGSLAAGSAADVTVIDPAAEWTVEPASFETKGRNSPFAGWKVQGRCVLTLVDGRIVFRLGGAEGSR
jgi:dihydroorotase